MTGATETKSPAQGAPMESGSTQVAPGARASAGGGASALAKVLPWIAAAALLAVLPAIFSSGSAITIMNQMAITVVFALAYNMLLGQGGMLSFGHAVYMGLGGFFVMHMLNWVEDGAIPMTLPLVPLFGGLFGMFFGVLIGSFSTNRSGVTFAMISLGVGELIAACSVIVVVFFGGEEGVSGDRTYAPFFGIEFLSQIEVYYLTAFWVLISALGMWLFSRTPLGRMANAVRDNPERAEFLGYSARWVRFGSFVFSGFFAGVAGALFAINYEILTEENLNLATSGSILLVTFLGGMGFFLGPVIGAVVFTLLQTVLGLQTELWQLYVGALFVAAVMFFPQGLAGLLAMHATPWRLGKTGLLVAPYLKTLLPGVIGILGCAGLVELLFHVKAGQEGLLEMFWSTWDAHSVLPWIVFGVLAAGGIWIARRNAPDLFEAWNEATTPDAAHDGGK